MYMSTQITRILKASGLNDSEIAVYLASISINVPQTSGVVSKRANLKPSTTTMALQSLTQKGLISSFQKENSTFYTAESPEQLLKMLEKKQFEIDLVKHDVEKILPEIEKTISPFVIKPRIKIYEGKEAIEQVFLDMIDQDDLMRGYAGFKSQFEDPLHEFWDSYFAKLRQKNKFLHLIATDKAGATQFQKLDKINNRKTLLTPGATCDLETEKQIAGDRVATISLYQDTMLAVVIEDAKIAQSERQFFDLTWKLLESGRI